MRRLPSSAQLLTLSSLYVSVTTSTSRGYELISVSIVKGPVSPCTSAGLCLEFCFRRTIITVVILNRGP